MQQESVSSFTAELIDNLSISLAGQSTGNHGLSLAAGEKSGTVHPGQKSGAHGQRTYHLGVTAVDTRFAV